ncbi:MAG: hypothetical protein C0514_02095 [Candidatus Puniceispirillum sp.]|nr:hypothetical protein [Candidatus Puniceispirillum sp.]
MFDLATIRGCVDIPRDLGCLLTTQRQAFVDFSGGLYDVPCPMQFAFPGDSSDCHIKGAHKRGSQELVLKIAGSSKLGNNGLILILDTLTWQVRAILNDEGFLTTLRTALAGILVAERLPWAPTNIGIVGSGYLAKQLHDLARLRFPEARIAVWSRTPGKAHAISSHTYNTPDALVAYCDTVFTTTASKSPLIETLPPNPRLALICLGSDDAEKSELSPMLFAQADCVLVDSLSQAAKYGDIARALKKGVLPPSAPIELGAALTLGINKNARRIIADFSGIGAQDAAMAAFVVPRLSMT